MMIAIYYEGQSISNDTFSISHSSDDGFVFGISQLILQRKIWNFHKILNYLSRNWKHKN